MSSINIETSSSSASKDTLALSGRIANTDARRDSIQNYLIFDHWKSYKPKCITASTWDYTYKTQKQIGDATSIVLKGYIEDIIALSSNEAQLIIRDRFSHRYFIVNMGISQADSILHLDKNHVFAFLLVKDLKHGFQIINEFSGWSGTEDEIEIDYKKNYELLTWCTLIDMVYDE